LSDPDYQIIAFEARVVDDDDDESGGDDIQLLLPPKDDIDAVLGTERWIIRQAESEALGLNAATQVEMVGIHGVGSKSEEGDLTGGVCGDKRLDW
jgi:nitrite reductase (NAD(P)H)